MRIGRIHGEVAPYSHSRGTEASTSTAGSDDEVDTMVPGDIPLETDPQRSALMRRVRQKGTRPEVMVGAALRSLGIAYRKNVRPLPGSPDFANKRRRWAVFVNGCYWHHHRCKRGTIPTRNKDFWVAKFVANRSRDARKVRALRKLGYRVLLVWECEVLQGEPMLRKLRKLAGPSSDALDGQ